MLGLPASWIGSSGSDERPTTTPRVQIPIHRGLWAPISGIHDGTASCSCGCGYGCFVSSSSISITASVITNVVIII